MNGLYTKAEPGPYGRADVDIAVRQAICELDRACEKHPTWPTRLTAHTAAAVTAGRRSLQRINDGFDHGVQPTADTIFSEEYCEMIEAAQRGDVKEARKECIQAIAMLLRLYVHLPHYCAVARGEVQP